MRRVLPSQIVAFIDAAIPNAPEIQEKGQPISIDSSENSFLKALSSLLNRFDEAFLPTGEDYITFVTARAVIDAVLEEWHGCEVARPLKHIPGSDENPVILIRQVLERCTDRLVPAAVSGFEFISDPAYREQLRDEMASIETLFKYGEWKAVMVMASSLMEAILCEKLAEMEEKYLKAGIAIAIRKETIRKNTKPNPFTWNLPTYVHVSAEAGLVTGRTREQALLAGDYRNLVHPGKTRREAVECNKAAALSVVAGLEHILADLTRGPKRNDGPSNR